MKPLSFPDNSYLHLLIMGGISILVFVVYHQTLFYDFVYLDDLQFVINNTHLSKGFSKENLIWTFSSSTDISKYYIPVTWLSFIMDYSLYGLNPGGFHLTNLLLHLVNANLLFIALLKFTKRTYLCTFVACLFAVHPLHVESVAWISERKDVLSTFFFLLTVLSYYYYTKQPSIRTYALVMICFLLGLLSKPMLVTLPFIMLLIDLWPAGRIRLGDSVTFPSTRPDFFQLLKEKIPFFIVISILSIAAYMTQEKGHAITPLSLYPMEMRIQNMPVAYWVYLKKMIWPTDLAVHYPYPGQMPYTVIVPSFIMFLGVCLYSLSAVKKHPFVTVGWWWFVITLFPVIGIVIIGPYLVADRYAYISMIGIYIILVWGVDALVQKFRKLRLWASLAGILIFSGLVLLSWNQVKHWENSETIFQQSLSIAPANSVAHHNLATYYDHNKNYPKAILHYEEAIRISPKYTEAYFNLGKTYFKTKEYRKAIKNFFKVTVLNPKHAVAYNHLGVAYRFVNDFDNGIASFQKAIKIDPGYDAAKKNLRLIRSEKTKNISREASSRKHNE